MPYTSKTKEQRIREMIERYEDYKADHEKNEDGRTEFNKGVVAACHWIIDHLKKL